MQTSSQTTTASTRFDLGGELSVNRLGYGAMRLTGQPGNFGPYADWEGGKALLRRAVELGIDFIDTAHAYGPGWNEDLIRDALQPYPAVVIATKGGVGKRSPTEIFSDGSAQALRANVEESLRRLRLERIDLYQFHRPDPRVPLAQSVATLSSLRDEGKIRLIGLSNVDQNQLEEALGVTPIASVQNRYNRAERGDDTLIDFCAARGIAFIPYGPLGAHPMQRGAPLAAGSAGTGATPAQSALRWLLDRSPNIIVIPGTITVAHLEENAAVWAA